MAPKIDPELAKSLIQEFQDQNGSDGGPSIKTIEGHHLRSYFIDRKSVEEILKDPKVYGITLTHAKHPDAAGKPVDASTLLYSGTVPVTASSVAAPMDVYGPAPTCPPFCPPPPPDNI